jgi:hypothetical protein
VTITSPGIALALGEFFIGSIGVAGSKSAVGGSPKFGSKLTPSVEVPVAALASMTEGVSLELSVFSAPDRVIGELSSEQAKAIAVSEIALRFSANVRLINPPS